ncbi:MAG: mannose-6-phosphate isomerase [Acidobacteria bacterium]|nr:MAG: mannose-6-phosphate isomerase [Acidobacteriota bacterium]HEU0046828.1 phosphomannose isomerase type II C-terminal cupin domain [Nitrososphaera sp.]
MAKKDKEDPRSSIYEERRPWGGFRRYTHNQVSTVKIITVNPGDILSLQYHHHRDELWVALDSGLQVTLGNQVWKPKPYEEIFIPHGTTHRMAGVGDRPSRWLEISFGEFDEDDIVRLEDHYGRK